MAYRSEALEDALAESGIVLVTERSRQHGNRQQVEIALATLKREFRLEQTLATTLVGLVTRIAAKVTAYTYGYFVNRLLGCPYTLGVSCEFTIPSDPRTSDVADRDGH